MMGVHCVFSFVIIAVLCESLSVPVNVNSDDILDTVDPTEYFTGSQYRPKLEIVRPENGQVLNDGILDIEIIISGFELPSHFDDSSTCIALSKDKGIIVVEHCFDQSPELIFHVNGLTPGESYTLRVLFLERGKVIALSVRSFKVGGVIGVLEDDESRPVSIQTALQVALEHQINGMHTQAEKIYQRILSESPSNADALNQLGIHFHQQGDHMTAIAYIQQALVSNHSVLADSYYNLGEVYRVIGLIDKAKEHLEISLLMNPTLTSAMYKLGLIYQQNLRQFEMAKALYRQLLRLELSSEHHSDSWLSNEELHECKVRECDLLGIIKRDNDESDSYEVLNCWKEGIAFFPSSGLMFNELGNNYLQRGMHEAAFHAYSNAVKLGFFIAFVNRASVLEIQGFIADARLSFQECVAEAVRLNVPHFHVRLRLATVMPRVLPSSDLELKDHRQLIESQLDVLLASTPPLNIENAAPINYGFSTGYYLVFHGLSNLALKQKMYRSYILFCPALSYGHFASGADAREKYSSGVSDKAVSGAPIFTRRGDVFSPVCSTGCDIIRESGVGAVDVLTTVNQVEAEFNFHVGVPTASDETTFLYWGEEDLGEWENVDFESKPVDNHRSTSLATNTQRHVPMNSFQSQDSRLPVIEDSLRGTIKSSTSNYKNDKHCHLRVGFVSRFFFSHPVGFLYEEVIRILSSSTDNDSRLNLTVEVFMVEGKSTADPVTRSILDNADMTHKLSPDLNELVDSIRLAKLDVLIYTDLGLDPITYFASFSRLAPIQVTGLGHPDTSGVSSIDYFVSDNVELPHAGASLYSESVVHMPGMGTCFVDRMLDAATALQSPRTALLDRAKYIEKIGIPRSAHIYVIVQPLYSLHSVFDDCIARILMQDKLGYIVILNPGNSWHSSHHTLYFNRLSSRLSNDAMKRVLTFQYLQTADFIHKSIAAAHVLLDPFPGGSYHSALHALTLGVPVITYPSQQLVGRLCLSLYKRMGYMELVVSSSLEFATLALTLAHKPKIRQNHVNSLMKFRSKLFDCSNVKNSWMQFFTAAIEGSSDIRLRNKLAPSHQD